MDALFSEERPFAEWKVFGFFRRPAQLFAELGSTHRYSKERLSELKAGDLICADAQTSGRGRHERKWLSPKGKNLYFNILYPLDGFAPHEFPQLMQVTAISIAQVLRDAGVNAAVKWPNDVLCEKKKVCGIFSELLAKGGEKLLTTGIGIDVNADEEDFQGIERPVTSLKLCLGRPWNREILLQRVVEKLESALDLARLRGISPWVEEWRKMDRFLGQPARIVEGDRTFDGVILDINDDGSLLFRLENGQIVTRYTGDVEI